MKKVLLTGATGFVGTHCINVLLKKGYIVHGISSKSVANGSENIQWHQVDLHNTEHVRSLMFTIKPDYLLHLAWEVTPHICWDSFENIRWVQSSLNLLQEFARSGGSRIVMIGSCAEYDWTYGYCTEDLTPLKPLNLYGECKKALSSIVLSAGSLYSISCAWARLFFLFGPNEHHERLVASVTSSLLRGEDALCSHGEQVRDYLYVKDAADALVELMHSQVEGAVNIGSGYPIMIKNLVDLTAEMIGRPELVKAGAITPAKDEPPLLLANTRRLNSEVAWTPRYTIEQGMSETVIWWKDRLGIIN